MHGHGNKVHRFQSLQGGSAAVLISYYTQIESPSSNLSRCKVSLNFRSPLLHRIKQSIQEKKLIRASMLHFIIVLVTVFYLPNKSFPSNQYHDITFLPKKLSNYSSFFPQLFKIYFPIFQVSQVNICPESCKRSQIYAG